MRGRDKGGGVREEGSKKKKNKNEVGGEEINREGEKGTERCGISPRRAAGR